MYSYEINNLIEYRNYLLKVEEYLNILGTSPQISRVKYDPYSDSFEIWTNDNCYWKFRLEPLEEQKVKKRNEVIL